VVPTRDPEPSSLARCLAALAQQTARSLRVIVVDDGSRDPEAVAAVVRRARNIEFLRLERVGISRARNAGARAAAASVVCFTDDDCEPDPEWAERLAAPIRAGRADAVGGLTLNARPRDPCAEATQASVNFLAGWRVQEWPRATFVPGSNLACRAAVLHELPFDERWPRSEDREWCSRLLASGRMLVIHPNAIVRHHLDAGFRAFWRRNVHYGRGAYDVRSARTRPRRLESPRFYFGLILDGFRRGPTVGVLSCIGQLAVAAGFVDAAARTPRRLSLRHQPR
jgi:glycosyltransferase involved in cell wall biosynthesis